MLLVSPDPASRALMALAMRSVERALGAELSFRAAANGELGIRAALRDRPDVVVADEIASGAGAFAVAKDLTGAATPFPGAVVLVLDRAQDEWLAEWSGADAWVVKPVDPFALSDIVTELVERRAVRKETV